MASFLGMCDVITRNFNDTCNVWVAAGCVIFVCGPSAFCLFLAYRLFNLRRRGDLAFEQKEHSSLRQAWRLAASAKGSCLLFPIFFLDEVNELRVHGSWSAESKSGVWWQWLMGDFTGGAWYYPALQVARKMYLTSVMAVVEGKEKAVLVCLLYVAEAMFLWRSRPFNDIPTLWCERISALTNLLAVFSVTLPAFGVEILPDMLIIAMATVGTGISAAVASITSLYSCLRILPSQLARVAGCKDSCLDFLCLCKAVSEPSNTGDVVKQGAQDGTRIVTNLMYDNAKEQAKQKRSKNTCTLSCLTRICPRGKLLADTYPGEHNGDLSEETGEDEVNFEVIEIQLGDVDAAKEMGHGGSDVNKCDDNDMHDDLDRTPAPQSIVETYRTASGVMSGDQDRSSVASCLEQGALHGLERMGRGEQKACVSVRAAMFEGGNPISKMRLYEILERSKRLHESRSKGLLGSRSPRANDSGRERDERGIEISTARIWT